MADAAQAASITILEADLEDAAHCAGVVECVDAYAGDVMGGQRPLSAEVRDAMIPGLRRASSRLILLARSENQIVGAAICFSGFSTFSAKPRLNVHDLTVLPDFRGRGVGRKLLEGVIARAERLGCSGVTLEVRKDNANARHLYRSLGFGDGRHPMEFWERKL